MVTRIENLAERFFESAGVVEPAGYRSIEVLLHEDVRPYFDGRDHMHITFSTDVARETTNAELLTYGSPMLESMAESAKAIGGVSHLYLKGLNLTTGRTLEKIERCAGIPGYILESGDENYFMYHHAYFCFKTALVSDEREEMIHQPAVDLHSGWTTTELNSRVLFPHASEDGTDVELETPLRLPLAQACQKAVSTLSDSISQRTATRRKELERTIRDEKAMVRRHYDKLIDTLEKGKQRKSANLARIDDKIQAAEADRQRRLEDVESKFHLQIEMELTQLAVISYPKVGVPLLIRQGKKQITGLAVWDPLVHQGYFHSLNRKNRD